MTSPLPRGTAAGDQSPPAGPCGIPEDDLHKLVAEKVRAYRRARRLAILRRLIGKAGRVPPKPRL